MTAPVRYQRNAHRFRSGPCELCSRSARLVAEHCHRHGWIRGRACESCNQFLRHLERRTSLAELVAKIPRQRRRRPALFEDYARLAAWLGRCPDCAASLEVLSDPSGAVNRDGLPRVGRRGAVQDVDGPAEL